MPSWIERAASRGILTTRYPREAANDGEVPFTGRAPVPPGPTGTSPAAIAGCPVGAIGPTSVDPARCIRCARCLTHGFRFAGPVEASIPGPAAGMPSGPVGRTTEPAPLAPFGRSLHLFLVDVGSCHACNLEVLALANPFYDVSRLGLFFTNSPRHADVLLVVGVPSEGMVEPARRAYDAMPYPKAVVAVGACPASGGAFRGNPGLRPSLSEVLPVDRFVPGCPPTPVQILDAVLHVAGRARRQG